MVGLFFEPSYLSFLSYAVARLNLNLYVVFNKPSVLQSNIFVPSKTLLMVYISFINLRLERLTKNNYLDCWCFYRLVFSDYNTVEPTHRGYCFGLSKKIAPNMSGAIIILILNFIISRSGIPISCSVHAAPLCSFLCSPPWARIRRT